MTESSEAISPNGAFSRRRFLRSGAAAVGLVTMGTALSSCSLPFIGGSDPAPEFPVESPEEALTRLLEGNARFASGKTTSINESTARRAEIVKRQKPFAMVFSCVDSRVPPELLFDRGLGDLFVIRTAGQVPDQAVMGSLEYGAFELEIPLLLVLGHKKCDAVKATIEVMERGAKPEASIGYLTDQLMPAVMKAKAQLEGADPEGGTDPAADAKTGATGATETTQAGNDFVAETTAPAQGSASETTLDPTETTAVPEPSASDQKAADDLLTAAITENVAETVAKLEQAPLIVERIRKDRLMVVGGVYDLETGRVELTVNVPEGFGAAPVKKK